MRDRRFCQPLFTLGHLHLDAGRFASRVGATGLGFVELQRHECRWPATTPSSASGPPRFRPVGDSIAVCPNSSRRASTPSCSTSRTASSQLGSSALGPLFGRSQLRCGSAAVDGQSKLVRATASPNSRCNAQPRAVFDLLNLGSGLSQQVRRPDRCEVFLTSRSSCDSNFRLVECPKPRNWLRREIRPVEVSSRDPTTSVPSADSTNSPAIA